MDSKLLILLALVAATLVAGRLLRRYFENAPIPKRFEHRDVGASEARPLIVEFTSPYCIECEEALPAIRAAAADHDAPIAVIDARQRPDLTTKYAIRSTPTILVVDSGGTVRKGWAHNPPEQELRRVVAAVTA